MTKRWTESEINNLKSGKVVPGRTEYAIRNQILRLGLKTKKSPRRPWKPEEINKLKELHEQGYSAKKIHEMKIFNTGVFGIQHKLRRIGLTKGKKISKLSKDTRDSLKNFLLENYQGKTPLELTEMWNKQNIKKVSYKKILSYLYNLKIKIPYYEVQKINNLRKKEKKLIESSKTITSDIKAAIRMERVKLMRSRIEKKLDIWTGLKTGISLQDLWKDDVLSV